MLSRLFICRGLAASAAALVLMVGVSGPVAETRAYQHNQTDLEIQAVVSHPVPNIEFDASKNEVAIETL